MNRYVKASSTIAGGIAPARRAAFALSCICVLGLVAFLGAGAPAASAAEGCPNETLREDQHATYLPDCRAYELASPIAKSGGEMMPNTQRTVATPSGDAVAFASLSGIGDVAGTTLASDYIAERTGQSGTQGWVTHGITPREPDLSFLGAIFGLDPVYPAYSADLRHGVYRAYQPIAGVDPGKSPLINLYTRDDLRTPGLGHYTLASPSVNSIENLTERPSFAAASTDLSKISFESSIDLTADASGSATKLYESEGGVLRLAGRVPPSGQTECDDATHSPDCEAAPSSVAGPAATANHFTSSMVSADGSRVFFEAAGAVYVREDGQRTLQLNPSADLEYATPDGSKVFFTKSGELFEYDFDRPAGERLTLLSPDAEPADGRAVGGIVGASEDGSYVYFITRGQLVAGEPVNNGGVEDLYLWHEGQLRYLGSLALEDGDRNEFARSTWNFINLLSDNARVSPDGRHLLFMATDPSGLEGREGFAGYANSHECKNENANGTFCRELFVYDAEANQLRCASCNPSGVASNVAPGWAATAYAVNGSNSALRSHLGRNLSTDGRYVFFSTEESLVSRDTNGRFDAYVYDTEGEEVHLLSSGTTATDSYFMDASEDGHDAFIATSERLVGWDDDDAFDLYDVRTDGGMPEPVATAAPCNGEGSCRGSAPGEPTPLNAASASLRGRGNPKLRRHKSRHHRHHPKHHRTAKHNRRASR